MRKLIRIITFFVIGLCAGAALPQSPKPATPPVISDALKAQFFKAQSQKVQADINAQQAQQALQRAAEALGAACGAAFQPQLDGAGDPVCAAKPVAKEAKPNGK